VKIGFIGSGNMGGAIFKGFIKNNAVKAEDIYIYRLSKEKLMKDADEYGINAAQSYSELISKTDCIIMAVKPNVLRNLLTEISAYINNKLIVSIAAGVEIAEIEKLLGFKAPIIRVMPNINAEICMSATAYCCNDMVSSEQIEFITSIFNKIGMTAEIEEDKFAIFSAIAGCSPAYVYLFIDSLAKGAQKLGMNKKQALKIAAYAALGSSKMLIDSDMHPCELADRVCSPGGTTIEGLCTLEDYRFESALVKAVEASVKKDKILSGK